MNDAEKTQCIVAIGLAVRHLTALLPVSAEVCFRNACWSYGHDEAKDTLQWCRESLSYSVGIRHADYSTVSSMLWRWR